MGYLEQLWHTISSFEFNGTWWQYLLALIAVFLIIIAAVGFFESIGDQIPTILVLTMGIICAWSMVELTEMGKSWFAALFQVGLFCALFCAPLVCTMYYLEDRKKRKS